MRRITGISPATVQRRRRHVTAGALTGLVALAALVVSTATVAAQGDATITLAATSSDVGTYLVDPSGLTLYYFTRDVTPGVSTCSDGCLDAWPPLLVGDGQELAAGDGVAGVLGVIPRDDGSMQATYDGRPLYHWQGDTEAGQTNGQGINGVWFVALEDGSSPPDPPALTLATSTTDLGTFLTGRDGLTTYFFAKDTTPGVSTCQGDCLTSWPAVTVPPGDTVAAGDGVIGVLGLVADSDGSMQVTYDGRPLYYFQGDAEAGQTNGQGVKGAWFVADATGALSTG